ncbi:MAG: hypothetical protein GZ088_09410 [Acidipila sp.]|nr:hypothetical protein [Acidipila sp.]
MSATPPNTDPLKSIKETAAGINKQAAEATAEIRRVSQELRKAYVGVEVWLEEPLILDEGEYEYKLGYAKHESGGWGLVMHEVSSDAEIAMLENAPRRVRIAAAPFIPALLKLIDEELKRQ